MTGRTGPSSVSDGPASESLFHGWYQSGSPEKAKPMGAGGRERGERERGQILQNWLIQLWGPTGVTPVKPASELETRERAESDPQAEHQAEPVLQAGGRIPPSGNPRLRSQPRPLLGRGPPSPWRVMGLPTSAAFSVNHIEEIPSQRHQGWCLTRWPGRTAQPRGQ